MLLTNRIHSTRMTPGPFETPIDRDHLRLYVNQWLPKPVIDGRASYLDDDLMWEVNGVPRENST